MTPSCIVTPENTADVATTVRTLGFWMKWSVQQCQFAIRSGGHAPAVGAANIDGGVVIDLRVLSEVVVNEEKTVASVGPAARWGNVYMKLDAMDLSVVGGRVFDVGVGGLMTGGIVASGSVDCVHANIISQVECPSSVLAMAGDVTMSKTMKSSSPVVKLSMSTKTRIKISGPYSRGDPTTSAS